MSDANTPRLKDPSGNSRVLLPDQAPPPQHTFWHNFWQVLKTIQARLRFIAILAIVAATIVYLGHAQGPLREMDPPALRRGGSGQRRHGILVPHAPDRCPGPSGQVPDLRHAPLETQESRRRGCGARPCRPGW